MELDINDFEMKGNNIGKINCWELYHFQEA